MKKLICGAAISLLTLCPLAAQAAEDSGRLYLDESYINTMTGELHIVISLAAAAQWMADLAEGKVLVNYIDLPGPKGSAPKAAAKGKPAASDKKDKAPVLPDLKELTGYTREELEALYQLAGPEQVDAIMNEQGMPGFSDVLKAYDILNDAEKNTDVSEEGEEEQEGDSETAGQETEITPSGDSGIIRSR